MLVATLALIPVMATPVSPGELPPPISQEVISSAWALMTLLTVAIAAGAVAGALPRLEGEGDAVFSMFLIIGLGQASAVVVLASLSRRRWTPEWWRIIVPLSLFQFVGFVVTLFLIGFASEAMGMNLRDEILLGSCIHGAFLVLGYFTIVAVLGTRSIAFSFRWLLLGVLMMAVGATEWMKLLGLSMRAVEPAEWMKSWPAVPMLMFVAARHALLNLQTHRNPVPTIGSALNLQRLALWIATLALMTLLKFGCSSVLPSVIDLTGKPFGSSMYFILEGVRGGLLDALVFATFWLGFRYFYVSRIDLRDLRRWALDVTSTT
jgi:hypothetical protein